MLWIQGFHVIFVVCWFAGIFYLPRILVYYAQSPDVETKAVLAVMARKLYRFVTPFMVLAIGAGPVAPQLSVGVLPVVGLDDR